MAPWVRIGLHARNDYQFAEADYRLIREARIETLKTLSLTDPAVYRRLRRENPHLEFIVRLWDDRMGVKRHPSPQEFTQRLIPRIQELQPFATKFEIHNEPNHYQCYEGWGPTDEDAVDFRNWYMEVLRILRATCPWASFGFPGLAINYPHRDLEWLDICREAIEASDWLGVHCYWQYGNMLSEDWGLRFKKYHERFPTKRLEITEFGNTTPNLDPHEMARQYVAYYQEVQKYPYLGSACSFIASSPDPQWQPLAWRKESGEFLPVVHAVGAIPRPSLERERYFSQTNCTVRGAFLAFLERYGVELCGYPITNELSEGGFPTQYFENLVLVQREPGRVQPRAVGRELINLRKWMPGVSKPPITDLTDSLPHHPSRHFPTRALSDIRYVVIHHSATPPNISLKRIAETHVKGRGWAGIGYHFVIKASGEICQTNPLNVICRTGTWGVEVCLLGNFTYTVPPEAQLESCAHLCAYLLSELGLPLERIKGARELIATASPGRQWMEGRAWKNDLLKRVQAIQEEVGMHKPVWHYVLFRQHPDDLARRDWENAANYIARFRPTCGFSIDDARNAQYVTIIGGEDGVSREEEETLKAAGCRVERVARPTPEETKRLLDEMARKGQRFLTF